MRNKIFISFIIIFVGAGFKPAGALEHSQKGGLFSMDIPAEWHWMEYPQEIVITFPDGQTMAIDIQMVASRPMSSADMKKAIELANNKMKQGIAAHNGVFIDEKEISIDGIYATQLDFQTASPDLVSVAYISFFNKSYAFSITYGSGDPKIRSVMDDAVMTIKF